MAEKLFSIFHSSAIESFFVRGADAVHTFGYARDAWLLSIPACTFGMRLAFTLPVSAYLESVKARLERTRPVLDAIKSPLLHRYSIRYSEKMIAANTAAVLSRNRIGFLRMFLPALVQIPIFVSTSVTIRDMDSRGVFGLADSERPRFLLASVFSALTFSNFQFNRGKSVFSRVVPAVAASMAFPLSLGSSIYLNSYWISSASFSFIQNVFFRVLRRRGLR